MSTRLYANASAFDLGNYIALHDAAAARRVEEVRFAKGEYLYLPHNRTTHIFELINGVVKIGSYSKRGTEVPYEIIAPGDVFGNMNYLGGKFFYEYARALSSCTVRTYPLESFKELVISDPEIAKWYNTNAIRRWCRIEGRLFVICSEGSVERLDYLKKQLDFTVTDNEGHLLNVFDTLSKSDVASFLGVTRQTLASLLKRESGPVRSSAVSKREVGSATPLSS